MAYDAIVVGARVAGAATAMLLARRGLRVLMLDRAPDSGLDTLSTHALMRAGVLQLHRWGLLPSVAATTPAVRTTTLHYGDRSEVVRLKPRAGVESLYAPRRTVIDPILARAAVEAGVEARYGVIVSGVLRRDGRVVGVEGRDRRGRPFQARAPLVVGADGLWSVVAREVGAPVTWEGTGASAMIYGYWTGLQADGYRWYYRPGATAGFIPTNEGRVCVWVGAPAHRFPALRREGLETAFHRLLQESAPEAVATVAAARQVERLRGFPGVPGYLRKPWGEGWALVGDAGSFRDPLSAHGMSDALRDAELLSRAAALALGAEGRGYDRLAEYEALRDEVALPLARITDAVASYHWTLTGIEELLRSFSQAMGREVERIEELDRVERVAA
jgi:flavin-dependent dehydrogenase